MRRVLCNSAQLWDFANNLCAVSFAIEPNSGILPTTYNESVVCFLKQENKKTVTSNHLSSLIYF
jgi:hypothetical protein